MLSPALALPLAAGILPLLLLDGAAGVALGLGATAALTALVLWRVPLFAAQDAELVARLDLPAAIRDKSDGRDHAPGARAEPQRALPARRHRVGIVLAQHVGATARGDLRLALARVPCLRGELRETIQRPAGDRPELMSRDQPVGVVRQRQRRHAARPALEEHVRHSLLVRRADHGDGAIQQRRQARRAGEARAARGWACAAASARIRSLGSPTIQNRACGTRAASSANASGRL